MSMPVVITADSTVDLSRELIEETLAFVAETVSGYNTELFGLSGGKLAE